MKGFSPCLTQRRSSRFPQRKIIIWFIEKWSFELERDLLKHRFFISWKIRKCLISEKSGFRAFICLWTDVYDSSLVQLETSTACDTFKPTGLASWRAPMIPIECVWLIHNITVLVLIWLYNITVEALIVAAAADSQLGCVFLSGACLLVMFPPEMISTVIECLLLLACLPAHFVWSHVWTSKR